jgi:hypothetical protein
MSDTIEINPEFPLRRFAILPPEWTAFTSSAALCLVLPLFLRRDLPERARAVLAAGLDRYGPTFNEGDALALVARAERYLTANLWTGQRHELGDLREMLRLHAGRILEGRGREALTAAAYLATHVLSHCGDGSVSPGELWVLNEALLDARPIASEYHTLDGAEPGPFYRDLAAGLEEWMPGVFLRVPVGRRQALFQLTQLDAISYDNFAASGYGLAPSWPLSRSRAGDEWLVPFGEAVETLNRRVYPLLAQMQREDPARFADVPAAICGLLGGTPSPRPDLRERLEACDVRTPEVGVRALEYALGELRGLDTRARLAVYQRFMDVLQPLGNAPIRLLVGTLGGGVLALSAKAEHYPQKYFMPR